MHAWIPIVCVIGVLVVTILFVIDFVRECLK